MEAAEDKDGIYPHTHENGGIRKGARGSGGEKETGGRLEIADSVLFCICLGGRGGPQRE